MIEGSPIRF